MRRARWCGVVLSIAVLSVFLFFPSDSLFAKDGDLDLTFNSTGKVVTLIGSEASAFAVATQADGKIVAVGRAFTTTQDFALARYNTDGSLDTTFGSGGTVTTDFSNDFDQAFAIAIQPDHKIVVAGMAVVSGNADMALARYNLDGSLDATFGTGGKVTTDFSGHADAANAVAILPNGQILAAGRASNGSTFDFALARYNSNGLLDTTFGSSGKVITDFNGANDEALGMAVQPDGKIVLAGLATISGDADFGLARYNPDGSLDATFGTGGKVHTDFNGGFDQANAVALQTDGKIVASGNAFDVSVTDFAVARYNPNGSLDSTFGTGGKAENYFSGISGDSLNTMAILSNGDIVVAGSGLGGHFAMERLLHDGSLDPTFGTGGKVSTSFGTPFAGANGMTIQADGKIVLAGFVTSGTDLSPEPGGESVAGGSASGASVQPALGEPPVSQFLAEFALARYINQVCPIHTVHGHVSTGDPGHFSLIATPHAHHGQHGHTVPYDCPPHAPGHSPGLMPESGGESPIPTALSEAAPAIVAALNQNSVVINGKTGVKRGTVLQLFGPADGLTFTAPDARTGLNWTSNVPEVEIGGARAKVLFSGLAPGLNNVWQLNVLVPPEAGSGSWALVIRYDGELLDAIDVRVQ